MKMEKRLAFLLSIVLVFFLILSFNTLTIASQTDTAKILCVGPEEQYQTVQSAVNAASEGDTIFVKEGRYSENILISKNHITLKGESLEKSIIHTGDNRKVLIKIQDATGVTVEDLSIEQGHSGIWLEGCNSIVINRCTISSPEYWGIYNNNCIDTTISNCDISGCFQGIITSSPSGKIINNRIHHNNWGIEARDDESFITIEKNLIYQNSGKGVYISYSDFLCINNTISHNYSGIYLYQSRIKNPDEKTRKVLNNQLFYNTYTGIDVFECSGVSIDSNYIYTDKNNFREENHGIYSIASKKNVITNNIISNYKHGISLTRYSDEIVDQNNLIYGNDLIGNFIQAEDGGNSNRWNSDNKGNHWDNYQGSDSNGDNIGDTPYIINGNILSQDAYPVIPKQFSFTQPTRIPTSTPTPKPTYTPTKIPQYTPSPTPTSTQEATPTATDLVSNTPTPTETELISDTPTPTTIQTQPGIGIIAKPLSVVEPITVYPGGISLVQPSPTNSPTPVSTSIYTPTQPNTPTLSAAIPLMQTAPSSSAATVLKDIDKHWAREYIQHVAHSGLMSGKNDALFYPDALITRAECAQVLITLVKKLNSTNRTAYFTDVHPGDWYYYPVLSAFDEKIMMGSQDRSFQPNKPISREDLVVTLSNILTRYYGFRSIKALDKNGKLAVNSLGQPASKDSKGTLKLPFGDISHISPYALDSVATAVNYGLISGKSGNLFDPKGKTTRAEAAVIISKLLQKYGVPSSK